MSELPLGRVEDQGLEFKSKMALEKPDSIGKAVVGMLNGQKGEIWIGIGEEEGYAVKIEPIPDIDSARSSLWDHLVDTIEPSPTEKEIRIEVIDSRDGSVLRLVIDPDPSRQPYCQLRSGLGRVFVKRTGARLRPMSREEVFGKQTEDAVTEAEKRILKERSTLQERGDPVFWVRLLPVPGGNLPVTDPRLGKFLTDYSASGNRPAGWNFVNSFQTPKPGKNKLFTEDEGNTRTEIHSDGGVVFQTPLQDLSRQKDEIYPLSLLEYPTALFRLASALFTEFGLAKGQLLADAALIKIKGWSLRRGSPKAAAFMFGKGECFIEDRDLVWDAPLRFELDELRENPDRCGFRLVRRVYQAFGYFEKDIPREFDSTTGRLILE